MTDYAFVIADLAGYMALTEAHGGAEAARTVARYMELASGALTPGARLTARVGDQVLIVSDDPRSAVATALRLEETVDREPLFLGSESGSLSVLPSGRTGDISVRRSILRHALRRMRAADRFYASRTLHQPPETCPMCAACRSGPCDSRTSSSPWSYLNPDLRAGLWNWIS